MTVIRITLGAEPEKDLLRLFDRLASNVGKKEQNYKIFQIQAALKIQFNDDKSARRIITLLSKMDTLGHLNKKVIPDLKRVLKRSRKD